MATHMGTGCGVVVELTTPVEVTGRYSNRQIAEIASKLIDFALENRA